MNEEAEETPLFYCDKTSRPWVVVTVSTNVLFPTMKSVILSLCFSDTVVIVHSPVSRQVIITFSNIAKKMNG